MFKTSFLIVLLLFGSFVELDYRLPIDTINRKSIETLRLTDIGEFGLLRKERPGIPAHYHTGIDIKRPSTNYIHEPIYPISDGIVISKREDGPYAQIIIEHQLDKKFWTVYEHISGITVNLYDYVTPNTPIARFMNSGELDRFGWQFDHFHLEILKEQPYKLRQENSKPNRLFSSYTLVSYTRADLNKYFYAPLEFLKENLK